MSAAGTRERPRAVVTCPDCGDDREMSYEGARLIRAGKRSGRCASCAGVERNTSEAVAARAASVLEPAGEIRAWAAREWASFTVRERAAVSIGLEALLDAERPPLRAAA